MKLVEIKNSLAKLYYEPADFPLVLSDFLTIDDENQKILSQVVSIESTNKAEVNCAILKFSLEIKDNSTFSVYSGYVPALDAAVSKTENEVIKSVFSVDELIIGQLTNSSNLILNINPQILNKFLYIQSDRFEETRKLKEKILAYNQIKEKKTLVTDFDGVMTYPNGEIIELGKDFKLPINNDILNYIYENDLTGLTVEQKAIIQDIILEIQDYIKTLEDKYIPFNTLLEVVNDIYESDKSTGIILFRNKLIKYNQFGIFASKKEEIDSLNKALTDNSVVILKADNVNINEKWRKESLNFVLSTVKSGVYLMLDIQDEIADKEIINKLYKLENIKPIIFSGYDSAYASQLKSFAKDLILFKPEEQQKAFATYNSFLNKLVGEEFIVSGESTFYTPLMVKPCEEIISETFVEILEEKVLQLPVVEETVTEEITEEIQEEEELQEETNNPFVPVLEIEPLEEDILEIQDEIGHLTLEEGSSEELQNIFEESLEEEIAKDVDEIFYSNSSEEMAISADNDTDEEMFSDEDLDMLDDLNLEEEEEETLILEEEPEEEIPALEIIENITENDSIPSIPIYKTDMNENLKPDTNIKIAEGNIVYHEKYGRGVVEQLISYGKKTLCSIQFDNVGRRLLDPNLADLKQM